VAVARVEGYTVEEISERLALSRRAIERKLQLIRSKWAKELTANLDG
jgi:DNA-directed RNA polymerase specialized sigma24 family protein